MHLNIEEILNNGWGPSERLLQQSIPDTTYNKNDKIGRIADWLGVLDGRNKAHNKDKVMQKLPLTGALFAEEGQEDEFTVVDKKANSDKKNGHRGSIHRRVSTQKPRMSVSNKSSSHQKRRWSFWKEDKKDKKYFTIPETWSVLKEIEMARLKGLQANASEPEEILKIGEVWQFDKSFDKINSKSDFRIQKSILRLPSVPVEKDSFIKTLQQEHGIQVTTSESVLTTLMALPFSVFPWAVKAIRIGNNLILDAREDSMIDYVAVNENVSEQAEYDPEPFNSPNSLMDESTNVNSWFLQQAVKEDGKLVFGEQLCQGEYHPISHSYRKISLGEINVLVRCQIDATALLKDESVTCLVRCLNEVDPKVSGIDYRQKVDHQRGSILAAERTNNANRLAKLAYQSIISGVELIKLGYVSRVNTKEPNQHLILGVDTYRPDDFLEKIDVDIHNGWGIVKVLVDILLNFPEGEYLIAKDYGKPAIKIYQASEIEK